MPAAEEITTFTDVAPPTGASPWVIAPTIEPIEVVEPDPDWPLAYRRVAARIRDALGARVLQLTHVGSTSVPGLPAKPVIDVDLAVADPGRESAWLPALESAGFVLTVREPWWHEHRCLRGVVPRANVHVFGPDSPELWRHRIFRDHLRRDAADRDLYARAKRAAAAGGPEAGQSVMEYNARKERTVRDIYGRAFVAAGLADRPPRRR